MRPSSGRDIDHWLRQSSNMMIFRTVDSICHHIITQIFNHHTKEKNDEWKTMTTNNIIAAYSSLVADSYFKYEAWTMTHHPELVNWYKSVRIWGGLTVAIPCTTHDCYSRQTESKSPRSTQCTENRKSEFHNAVQMVRQTVFRRRC